MNKDLIRRVRDQIAAEPGSFDMIHWLAEDGHDTANAEKPEAAVHVLAGYDNWLNVCGTAACACGTALVMATPLEREDAIAFLYSHGYDDDGCDDEGDPSEWEVVGARLFGLPIPLAISLFAPYSDFWARQLDVLHHQMIERARVCTAIEMVDVLDDLLAADDPATVLDR